MDTKKLRQKILDLAIHGKLVPQDPNDEPASVLLERIKAEKERLIKEGKIKRSRKAKETTDMPHYVPFEIPNGWLWTTVKEICSKIGSGSTPRGSNYSLKGIPFFRSQNVYNDGIVLEDIKYISADVHQSMIGTEVLPYDLLLNITGGSLGRCAIVPENIIKGNVSQHVCILRPILVSSEYLHCFILSSFFSKTMKITGSGREGLPKYNLEKMLVPLPPLEEQSRIIKELKKLSNAITTIENQRNILSETINKTKIKILDLAIHGKLVPQDPNEEPSSELLKRINPKAEIACDNGHSRKLPIHWCQCKFKDVFKIVMGQSPKGESINNFDGIEFHQGKLNFTEKLVSHSTFRTNAPIKIVKPNSLLLCVRAPVGVVNIIKREVCIGRGLCALENCAALDKDYAFYAVKTYKDIFEKKSTGTTFKAISKNIIENESFFLPPIAEQKRIVNKIECLFVIIDEIKNSLEA